MNARRLSDGARGDRRDRADDEDLRSALIAALQLAFGFKPAWEVANYADESDQDLSLEALLIDAIGVARRTAKSTPSEQPVLVTNPSTLPDALDVLRRVGGIRGFVAALVDSKQGLSDEELALGRDVVHTFVAEAVEIRRAARFYWGRDARRPGSVYVIFDLIGRISVQSRADARHANIVVIGTALLLRSMLRKGEIEREGLDQLLLSIRELGSKSKAFIAVVDSLCPKDRQYFVHGGIARLKQQSEGEQRRIANNINAYLDANPEVRNALGLPESCERDVAAGFPR